jgi:urea transporter
MKHLRWTIQSIINSYAQVFFSKHLLFAVIILLVTFLNPWRGLAGLLAIVVANTAALLIGFNREKIRLGFYGFNALLAGLGLGSYYDFGWQLMLVVALAAFLSLVLSVMLEGVLGKYGLPYLSLPFVLAYWALTIASRQFTFLHINESGIYMLNDMYALGGKTLLGLYQYWTQIPFPASLKIYLSSLGAIFFEYGTFAGLLLAIGLLIYSRIGFILSLIGFYSAYYFYSIMGVGFTGAEYSNIGFNYILTAIAIGGYFVVPNRISFVWVLLLIPLTAIVSLSTSGMAALLQLPIYSLPFNIITLLFLYILKFRIQPKTLLNLVTYQHYSPEKNLYAFLNFKKRFGKYSPVPLGLPFYGDWTVTQGHAGEFTHKDDWQYAWDFEIRGREDKTYKGNGMDCSDYYCYGKNIVAPADGVVDSVTDDVEDNKVGVRNLKNNWGNSIVIKHADLLYSQISHLQKGSILPKPGQAVKKGDLIARCGNSGNSPYPHVHYQVQATPYLGSKTIHYSISNYFSTQDSSTRLKSVGIPVKDETVTNVQADKHLKNALHFVPGEKFEIRDSRFESKTFIWEVKIDYYLNKYIECKNTNSKAWFVVNDGMLYFTYFNGSHKSALYYFYIGCYSACFGMKPGLIVEDVLPVNRVFPWYVRIWQDFVAPFFIFLNGKYEMQYPRSNDPLLSDHLELNSNAATGLLYLEKQRSSCLVKIDAEGFAGFTVTTKNKKIECACLRN